MINAPKGFNRLDFEQIKHTAGLVGFEILACARKKKSCGPGCDWLVQDKRYYTLMLLKHIDGLLSCATVLPEVVLAWYETAKLAAAEYVEIEENLHPILKRITNSANYTD